MFLPKHKLDELDYWTVKCLEKDFGYTDRFTFHWKTAWWQFPKKQSVEFDRDREPSSDRLGCRCFAESSDAFELRKQLNAWTNDSFS